LKLGGATTELWIKGPTERVLGAIQASDIRPYQTLTAHEVADTPSIAAAMRTFGFLKALGFCAALLVLVGVLMYMQARQRSRVVSYSLARRMGLKRISHRWALALELAGMLVPSLVIGAVLGIASAQIVFARLDPLPQIPPDPLFRIPFGLAAAVLGVLIVVSIVGGWLTNRVAERPNLAEVMRVAA
jgi:putative ABC transport system permease protein